MLRWRLALNKCYAQRHSLLCRGDAPQPIDIYIHSAVSLGNLCEGCCPIDSPNSLSDVSFCSADANSVKCSCKISPHLKIGGNTVRFFRIWYQSHSGAVFVRKVDFVGADSWHEVIWSYGVSENWFHYVHAAVFQKRRRSAAQISAVWYWSQYPTWKQSQKTSFVVHYLL